MRSIVLTTGGFSAWAGGFALAILILPTILLTAEQALLERPKGLPGSILWPGSDKFSNDLAGCASRRYASHHDGDYARGGARGR